MTWAIDQKLHWTDHYVEYGFAVIKHAIPEDFTRPALDEVRRVLEFGDTPLNQWRLPKHAVHMPYNGSNYTTLPTVYDQPTFKKIVETFFGGTDHLSTDRAFQLFVSTFNPEGKADVSPNGHIDFVNTPVPIVGSGAMFQLSLVDAEPFSGNISIYPGSHKVIQKLLIDDPDRQFPTDPKINEALHAEPYEFVAEKGDLLIFHHLVGHSGNNNFAAGHTPRVVIHGQILLDIWPRDVDPVAPRFGPWERSMATNGKYRTRRDELEWIKSYKATNKKSAVAAY